MASPRIKKFISGTVIGKHEKGYQRDPDDRGNYVNKRLIGTKYGISAPTLQSFLGREIDEEDMKNLKRETAEKILYEDYYKKGRINKLPEDKQEQMLDFYINSGTTAIKEVQKRAGVTPDGIIGPDTANAINNLGNEDIVDTRVNLIKNSNKIHPKFKKGIKTRAKSFNKPIEEEEEEFMAIKRPEEDELRMFKRMARQDEDDRARETTRQARIKADEKITQEQQNEIYPFKETIADKIYAVDTAALNNVNMPVTVRKKLQQELHNTDNKITATAQALEEESQGKKSSTKNEFLKALTFFLPDIAGLAIGGAIGGEAGAAEGARLGGKARESYMGYKQQEKENEFAKEVHGDKMDLEQDKLDQRQQVDPMAIERLQISKANLKVRQDEYKLAEKRTSNLSEERYERRYERSNDRVLKQKDIFANQTIVKAEQETLRQINALRDLAEARVLPGTIGFKVAKGIAGEVGNLTENERKAAGIKPSIWKKIERYGAETFYGEIPESDLKLIKGVADQLQGKIEGRLRRRAGKFADSRKGNLTEAHAKTFKEDILLSIGISSDSLAKETEAKKGSHVDRVSKMSEEELDKYLEENK